MGVSAHRLSLVGATSQVAREIKERLASAGIPGSRIDLLDIEDEVGLLTEYGDEARVILEAAEQPLRKASLACFCAAPELAARIAPIIRDAGGVAIDCTGALDGDPGAVGAGAGATGPRIAVTPHAAASLLATLGEAIDLTAAVATILLPASERDEHGPEEMARQSSALLNLGLLEEDDEAPRRVAFDLWVGNEARERILAHLGRQGVPAPALSVVYAPVFHGVSASLFVPGADLDTVTDALRAASLTVQNDGEIDSPARVAGKDGVYVSGVRADRSGVWIWAVVDNYGATAAGAVNEILRVLGAETP